jgi:hypothetical protein
MKIVYAAVPAYTGSVLCQTAQCLMEEYSDALRRGWRFNTAFHIGNSMITRARNALVAHFLTTDSTDLFFVDSDLAWERGAMCRLLEHPVDMVCGAYPKRTEPLEWPLMLREDKNIAVDAKTGLIEVAAAPGGFMRISRSLVENMVRAHPELAYTEPFAPGGVAMSLFDFGRQGRNYIGEDYVFCQRVRAQGGRVWIDPDIQFEHIGQKSMKGRFKDWVATEAQRRDGALKRAQ